MKEGVRLCWPSWAESGDAKVSATMEIARCFQQEARYEKREYQHEKSRQESWHLGGGALSSGRFPCPKKP
jgi:hypothetical protein